MKQTILLCAFLNLFLSACATTAKLDSQTDTFTNGRNISTEPIPMISDAEQERVSCGTVDVCVSFKKKVVGTSISYEAAVSDGGEFKPPVNALKKDSLAFNVDGKIFALSTQMDAALTDQALGGIVSTYHAQNILYENVPREVLQAIAAGQKVKMQLKGPDHEKVGFVPKIGLLAVSNLLLAE